MTDARFGKQLLAAIQRLPFGSAVVFRHYHLSEQERGVLFGKVQRICRRRGHILLLAGPNAAMLARRWDADGVHSNKARTASNRIRSVPVHNIRELNHAKRTNAQYLLISPVFPTRSHPGQRSLGILGYSQLANRAGKARPIALGGMSRARAMAFGGRRITGWAGIDCFIK